MIARYLFLFLTFTGDDAFTIQHLGTGQCLTMGTSKGLTLTTCDSKNITQLWKWGSRRRLFHLATASCLALDLHTKAVSLMDCNTNYLLWWGCVDGAVYTVYQMGLAVTDGKVGTKRDTNDTWVRGETQENICQKPYRGECGFLWAFWDVRLNKTRAPCCLPVLWRLTGLIRKRKRFPKCLQ